MRNLQEQVKKALLPKIVLTFNYSSHFKIFKNSQPSLLNFKSFSRSQEHFFLAVGQNNFGNKTPFMANFVTSNIKIDNFSI